MDLERLQRKIGYRFSRPELLREALTHRSHGTPHNERLEFLGDSVVNCIVATELFARFGKLKEGELSRLRAHLVRQESLHRVAQAMGLGSFLRLGEGELRSGGFARPSILADAVEALIGAIYLDGGFGAAQQALRSLLAEPLAEIEPESFGKDPKTQLQELLQSRHVPLPRYSVVSTRGAAHDQRFEIECLVPELSIRTLGAGSSRRAAEQEAARRAFQELKEAK
ncbi:MAG: ribonuclease III [Betaproteobacteria bacterium RIFCSPLOWO2_02_FULL_65_24]|nr:MAG: ribonuclease III [Betaproteobacteria bacterium RIFCSPLOWO2_02_FULL_65_24]OGA95723.1 MAG: ribonuclease III [Betaproteobacteria bacterium RIFCSPLOWO2_12_FULL_66_14]